MSEVQSIIFAKDVYTKSLASSWLRSHGYRSEKVDSSRNFLRFRQESPRKYKDFRIKEITPGIKLVLGIGRKKSKSRKRSRRRKRSS